MLTIRTWEAMTDKEKDPFIVVAAELKHKHDANIIRECRTTNTIGKRKGKPRKKD